VTRIPLTQGKEAIIDDEDAARVLKHRWHAVQPRPGYFYAATILPRQATKTPLHRFILNPPTEMLVDHVNHDGLDNRRANLRVCTYRQNSLNSRPRKASGLPYKGVYRESRKGPWCPRCGKAWKKWRAEIRVNGKVRILGRFQSLEAAARSYDRAARRLHGEFAFLNFGSSNQPDSLQNPEAVNET